MTSTLAAQPPSVPVLALPSDRQLRLLSGVLVLGAITMLLDTTIVNVALEHLGTVFHSSVADTQWVASGYLLALSGVIPLSGWASERFGTRQVWLAAVSAFVLGSALCGLAWDLPSLIAFRVLQGAGGGLILPITITILAQAAGPARLAKAITAIMIPAQLAPVLGPVIGGTLVDSVSWRWLFAVNIPICFTALALGWRHLPASIPMRGARLDVPGFALLTPGIVAVVYGISRVGEAGFGAVRAWGPMAVGAALLVGFVVYALRTSRTSLVDVRPFARRSFGLASLITFLGGFSTFAVMFLLPLFYQGVRGESAFTTGLLLIPQGLGTITFGLLNARLTARFDTRLVVGGGIVLTVLGVIPFALAGPTGGTAVLLASQFLQGFGLGAALLPVMTVALAGLERDEVPRANAALSIVQRVGAPFGVTVVAVILQRYLADAGTTPAGMADAFGSAFWWVIAFSAAPLVLAALLPSGGTGRQASSAAASLTTSTSA